MGDLSARRLLMLDTKRRRYRLRLLNPVVLNQEPNADYLLLHGEALCHYLLREDPAAQIIARGPLPFLSGNKTTIGYLSPLTRLPHYSFVGGRGFAELLNLGLDAIVLCGEGRADEDYQHEYVVISGRAPHLTVEWKSAVSLPSGQRSAYYWLLEHELDGQPERGSIFAVGEGARLGFRMANLAVDGLYHAGRGGAGAVFARFTEAMVLRGEQLSWQDWFATGAEAFWELREGEIRQRLERFTKRLSRRDGGTVTKFYTTGSGDRPTLPARNGQRVGYDLADLGGRKVLEASREGQTGCQWCQVNCRHWHWVKADYAPGDRDRLLDDFEPSYAIFAMLDLQPEDDSLEARLRLMEAVDRGVILPIEQMGCDVIDMGVGLAALFEGLERGLIPAGDVPPFLRTGALLGDLGMAAQVVEAMRNSDPSPALRALGDGPQALAQQYPSIQGLLFTGGPGTLGNAGHANSLWTFLMPFSRFFGHYAGQLYKIEGTLPESGEAKAVQALFERVIDQGLRREYLSILCNTLSMCAFTFAIFSQDGRGDALDAGDLLIRTLASYDIEARRENLEWFAEAFWARSIAFKRECGWQPPSAADLPNRVFEILSLALDRPVDELQELMDWLIAEWKRRAEGVMYKYGFEALADW